MPHYNELPFKNVYYWGNIPHDPEEWHEPFVPASWPQNPGPIERLGPVADKEARCDSCHAKDGEAGRFPLLSSALNNGTEPNSGYCQTVLEGMLSHGFMPPPGEGVESDYQTHVDWLRAAYKTTPGTGEIVPSPGGDDASRISPPTIVTPIYRCAEVVGVRDLRLDAEVHVVIEDSTGTEKFRLGFLN